MAQQPRLQVRETKVQACLFCRAALNPVRPHRKRFCNDLCRTRFHHAQQKARQAALERELAEAKRALAALRGASGTSVVSRAPALPHG